VKEHVIADPHRVEPQLLAFTCEISWARRGAMDAICSFLKAVDEKTRTHLYRAAQH